MREPVCLLINDPRDLEDAIVRHYARQQEGLPPPLEPHPGYASLAEAWVTHKKWLAEQYPQGRVPQSQIVDMWRHYLKVRSNDELVDFQRTPQPFNPHVNLAQLIAEEWKAREEALRVPPPTPVALPDSPPEE